MQPFGSCEPGTLLFLKVAKIQSTATKGGQFPIANTILVADTLNHPIRVQAVVTQQKYNRVTILIGNPFQ